VIDLAFDPWVFEEYDFDPWSFDEYKPVPEVDVGSDAIEAKFKPTLVARAKKRTVQAHGKDWVVAGDTKLGDVYPFYGVEFNAGRYHCSCYDTQHGDTRARRICSHVLAVILFRRQTPTTPPEPVAAPPEPVPAPIAHQPTLVPARVFSCPDVSSFTNPGLPSFITDIRPHQWDAVTEAVEAFEAGADVVFVDAPTGSGKTLIGELVRRQLNAKAHYTCSSLTLQDQFVKDYPYAKLLKGRSNYPTEGYPFPEITAADCTKTPGDPESCLWCSHVLNCPYERAKMQALSADLTVINTAYLLAEANHIGKLSDRPLIVMDECDTLEWDLMGYVEFNLSTHRLERLGIEAPKKGVHKTTIATWLAEELMPGLREVYRGLKTYTDDVKKIRERNAIERLIGQASTVFSDLKQDLDEEAEGWVRDYPGDKTALALKPVKVDKFGEDVLWRHGERFLCMSATIISGHELSESLGIEESGRKWHVVKVPMTFPVENRRIHVAPVANMAQRNKEVAWPQVAAAISRVLARHPGERCLVHTVSYDLTKYLTDALGRSESDGRRILSYRNAQERARALADFRATPASVLLAPSFDRGVDLRDDDCRVVVVAKVPFPYLGDKQINARMRLPGGQEWYTVQTIRTLVQMTGRHVRSKDDWGVTYLLDSQFVSNIWKKNKHLLPTWWREALDMNFPTRELT
jgi:ATP-dependent DNA helicase DinG